MVASVNPATDPKIRQQYLEHFLKLAERGRRRAASGGEARCAKLAKAIVEHAAGIDGMAIAGAIEFLRMAAAMPETARNVIGG